MMSRTIVSIALICHIAALTVAAIPSTQELREVNGEQEGGTPNAPEMVDDAVSERVRPALSTVAGVVNGIAVSAWQLTSRTRPVATRYANMLGLGQRWNMFTNPPRGAEYLRLRYYSARPDRGGAWHVATELVFPLAPESDSHTLAAFWHGHRDKAISNALGAYFRVRLNRMDAGQAPPAIHELDGVLARTIVPVVGYFTGQYTQSHLKAGDRLVRTEAWYGWATSRARGGPAIAPQSREKAISRYYEGLTEQSISQPIFQPLDTLDREADILWMLIHVDQR